ncbi:MAG: hypothetical protein ACE5F6_20860 [Anaerolineae bacterium]
MKTSLNKHIPGDLPVILIEAKTTRAPDATSRPLVKEPAYAADPRTGRMLNPRAASLAGTTVAAPG